MRRTLAEIAAEPSRIARLARWPSLERVGMALKSGAVVRQDKRRHLAGWLAGCFYGTF